MLKSIRHAIAAVQFRQVNAHLGLAFHWLKIAHADAEGSVLQNNFAARAFFGGFGGLA